MKCNTCGSENLDVAHLCSSDFIEGEECNYCGNVVLETKQACESVDEESTYVCNTCGRKAVKPEYLCNPNLTS